MKIVLVIVTLFYVQLSFGQVNYKRTINTDSIVNKLGIKKAIAYFENELKLKPNNEDIIRWLGLLNIENNNLKNG